MNGERCRMDMILMAMAMETWFDPFFFFGTEEYGGVLAV